MSRLSFGIVQVEIVVVLLLLGAVYQKLDRREPGTSMSNPPSAHVFIDDKGRVVYPYLQREVKNTVTVHARDIQVCFNQFTERVPDAADSGTVHVDWRIDPQGKPTHVRVVFNAYQDKGLSSCVVEAFKRWRFPPPASELYAEHRFQFSKSRP